MLKAYDFSKFKGTGSMSRTNSLNHKENEIAEKLVLQLQGKESKSVSNTENCMVCGSRHVIDFFEKWGVIYYRCKDCNSIFMRTTPEILEEYKLNKDLIALRTSSRYQMEESENRDIVWEELVDWVKFRSFRYMGRNKGLDVIDYGNRYEGLISKIKESDLCDKYELRESILGETEKTRIDQADIVLYFNKIQQSLQPLKDLKEAYTALKDDGLLFFSTRIGTGFDILTLKGEGKVFPYEHVFLPSLDGLKMLLEEAGFKMLEYSTPGRRDIEYVCEHKNAIDPNDVFLEYMLETGDEIVFSDFQRFLQKSGLSSHAQIVAKREKLI